jgi:hypothetical protein
MASSGSSRTSDSEEEDETGSQHSSSSADSDDDAPSLASWHTDDSSDGEESYADGGQPVGRKTWQPVRPVRVGTGQTIEERYADGIVHGVPERVEQGRSSGSGKSTVKEKLELHTNLRRAVGTAAPSRPCEGGARELRDWVQAALLHGLSVESQARDARQTYWAMRRMLEVLARWFQPRTKVGNCRRSPKETALLLELSAALGLLGVYVHKPSRQDYLWTRYLDPDLQHKLLSKPTMLTPRVSTAVKEVLRLSSAQDAGKALLYAIVPRNSTKWYLGRTASLRKRGTCGAPGIQVRGLEHLAEILRDVKDKHSTLKYRVWRPLKEAAFIMVPLMQRDEDEIISLERWAIARDQPGAKKLGKKVERKQDWEHWQQNRGRIQ